jgi:hydroxyacylglutathione hydrolase
VLQIFTIPVTPFSQNARIFFESDSRQAVVVDPGGDLELIFERLDTLQAFQVRVLLTHAHIDHAGGTATCLRILRDKFGTVELAAHPDPTLRATIERQAKLFGLPPQEYRNAPEPELPINEGDRFSIGNFSAAVLWVPGHAPDHIALYFEVDQFELDEDDQCRELSAPVVLAGDTLFAGSIGRTDLPGGSMPTLLKSIREKLLVLPEQTIVLCGHGPSTTIGEEKQFNPFLN